jgi:hypothetical protein
VVDLLVDSGVNEWTIDSTQSAGSSRCLAARDESLIDMPQTAVEQFC